jgi:hypothetical protein
MIGHQSHHGHQIIMAIADKTNISHQDHHENHEHLSFHGSGSARIRIILLDPDLELSILMSELDLTNCCGLYNSIK